MIKESIKNKNADSLLDEEFGRFVDLPDHDNTIAKLAYYKAQNRCFEATVCSFPRSALFSLYHTGINNTDFT